MNNDGVWTDIPLGIWGRRAMWRTYFDLKSDKRVTEIQDTNRVTIVEKNPSLGPGGAEASGTLTLIAEGTGITGDLATNRLTDGIITSFTIEGDNGDSVAKITIAGFDPQDAGLFYKNMKSIATDYDYVQSLLAGDTIASVAPGSTGDATFDTGAGNDTVTGGTGDDFALKWQAGDLTFTGGRGSDTLEFSGLEETFTPPSGAVVNLTSGDGRNPYGGALRLRGVENVSGTTLADRLTGNGSDNALQGNGGGDRIFGKAGDDLISVRRDNDGTTDLIVADGGAGRDEVTISIITPFFPGFAGLSVLDLGTPSQSTGVFQAIRLVGFEAFVIAVNSPFGTPPPVEVRGSSASESVSMLGVSADTLVGLGGDDVLSGNFGEDALFGGAGRDTLSGGSDRDVLAGGLASDRFVFNDIGQAGLGATRDLVTDFAAGQDLIDLREVSNFAAFGSPFSFIGQDGFSGEGGEIRYVLINRAGTANDRTIIEIDRSTPGVIGMEIELVGLVELTEADFILS